MEKVGHDGSSMSFDKIVKRGLCCWEKNLQVINVGLWTIEHPYSWLKLCFRVNTKSAPLREQAVWLSSFVAAVIALEMGWGEPCLVLLGSTKKDVINVLDGGLARHFLHSLWLELQCMTIECKNHTTTQGKYISFTSGFLSHSGIYLPNIKGEKIK